MAVVIDVDASVQFVDATTADGDLVLIEELDDDECECGRCAWTVLELTGGDDA